MSNNLKRIPTPGESTLILPAKCLLCGIKFQIPARVYELDGSTPTPELLKFSHKISEHLSKFHPERINLNLAVYQMYDSYSVMACFELNGPLWTEFEKMRHQLHKHTRRVRVSDQKLLEKLTGLKLINPADQTRVLELLTEMRDVYEEIGLFPEIDAAEKAAQEKGRGGAIADPAPQA